jgi:hypothetical protein
MSRWRLPPVLIQSPFLAVLSLLCTKHLVIMLYEPNLILDVDHDHPCDTDTPDIHCTLPTAKMVEAVIHLHLHLHLHLIERWAIRSVRPLGVPTEQLCR